MMTRDERYAAWVRHNWKRWVSAGSYLNGGTVDMDAVHASRRAYLAEVHPETYAQPCRAIVPYVAPVSAPKPTTPVVICLPAPLVISLWHESMRVA